MLPPLSQWTKTHCGVLTGWLASPPHDIIHHGQKLKKKKKKLSWALWWCVRGGGGAHRTLTWLWNCLPGTNADCRDVFFYIRMPQQVTAATRDTVALFFFLQSGLKSAVCCTGSQTWSVFMRHVTFGLRVARTHMLHLSFFLLAHLV